MRLSLFVLFLLASLPAAAVKAAPFAEYNPATGDVTLRGLTGLVAFSFNSKFGFLNKDLANLPPQYSPPDAPPPLVDDAHSGGPGYLVQWKPGLGETQILFDSLYLPEAVTPFTPIRNELQFAARFPSDSSTRHWEIRIVPEPASTSLALCGIAVMGLALRRRK